MQFHFYGSPQPVVSPSGSFTRLLWSAEASITSHADWLSKHRPDKPKFMGHRRYAGAMLSVCRLDHSLPGGGPPNGRRRMMTKVVSVVEDDQSVRESMSRLLRSLGYTVEIFSSATEFL